MFDPKQLKPILVLVAIALPPLPIAIGLAPPPRMVKSALTKSTVPFRLMVSPTTSPKFVVPFTCSEFLTVVVPVVAPILTAVAAPKALIVVAVVLNTANVVLPVRTLVVNVGDVANTATPVPVSSLRTPRSCAELVDPNTDRLLVV